MIRKGQKNYLDPISEVDIPKIATHTFNTDLAQLYSQYDIEITMMPILKKITNNRMKKNSCINHQIEFYNELKRFQR